LQGDPAFTNVYFNMSHGDGEMSGSWNAGPQWQRVSDREEQTAADGGDGIASVALTAHEAEMLEKTAARTMSDPTSDPVTGAELGQRGSAVS